MRSQKLKKFLAKKFIESASIIFTLLFMFAGIVYAYTTWAPGGPPQAAPGAGNVELPIGGSAPSGAIMAFNLGACPAGWTELVAARGRTIVGLNPGDTSFNAQGETGGAKTHTLTIAEMPAHTHGLNVDISAAGAYSNPTGANGVDAVDNDTVRSTGGGGPHNNLQPYIAFIYCQKD